MGSLALHRTQPATRYVLRNLCAGLSVTADWQGAIASWPPALGQALGRPAHDLLGHFVFGSLISFDDLGVAAREWCTFLDGGPYPETPAHVHVGVLSATGRVPATATFVPILRSEVFETALFLERAGDDRTMTVDEATMIVERDYPCLSAAIRRTATGASPRTSQEIAGTLVVFDIE